MGFWNGLGGLFRLVIAAAFRWAVRWYKGSPRKPATSPYIRHQPYRSPPTRREYTPIPRPPPIIPSDNPVYRIRKPNPEYVPGNDTRPRGIIYGNDFSDPYHTVRDSTKGYPTNSIRFYTPKSPYTSKLNILYNGRNNIIYRRKRKREAYV